MNNSVGLNQSLKQQLSLSPQLIQTFEILAMSTLELQQKIRNEIEMNPALEIPNESVVSLERIAERETSTHEEDFSDTTAYDPDRPRAGSNIHESSSYDQEASDRNQMYLEGALARSETLQEHLMRQLGCLRLQDEHMEIGRLIISNLDQNGFHQQPPESLVKPRQREILQSMIGVVQNLDPPGIAAADFRESLILQAKFDKLVGNDLKNFSALVNDHLEQMRQNKIKEVAKTLGIPEEELEILYQYLKTLNPFPGLQYSADEIQYAVPDLIVRKIDGRLQLRLNTENLPTLSIDPDFSQLMGNPRDKAYKETNAYIHNAIKSANLLISQIQMRSDTMKKIGIELVKFQHEFFLNGPRSLKPLTYRMIAEDLSLHETTISRAVQGKYIDTDYGIMPIKQLFSSAIQTVDPEGEDLSKRAVMDIMQEIISGHTGSKPLSDQKIADLLAERGIKIARRTVSKYRLSLNIDSSYVRNS
jgi:RNA polymerase sigma-54 factor